MGAELQFGPVRLEFQFLSGWPWAYAVCVCVCARSFRDFHVSEAAFPESVYSLGCYAANLNPDSELHRNIHPLLLLSALLY